MLMILVTTLYGQSNSLLPSEFVEGVILLKKELAMPDVECCGKNMVWHVDEGLLGDDWHSQMVVAADDTTSSLYSLDGGTARHFMLMESGVLDLGFESGLRRVAYDVPTTGHLKSVRSADGSEIVLDYDRGPYTASLGYTQLFTLLKIGDKSYTVSGSPAPSYSGNLLSPVYLSGVRGRDFSMRLYRSDSNELDYDDIAYSSVLGRSPDSYNREPYRYLQEGGLRTVSQMSSQRHNSIIST